MLLYLTFIASFVDQTGAPAWIYCTGSAPDEDFPGDQTFGTWLRHRYLQIGEPFFSELYQKQCKHLKAFFVNPDYGSVRRSTLISPLLVINLCPFFKKRRQALSLRSHREVFNFNTFLFLNQNCGIFLNTKPTTKKETFLSTQHMISRCHFLLDFWMQFLSWKLIWMLLLSILFDIV